MIATILIVGIALAWLGYESDWLTIRLPYGATSQPASLLTPETTRATMPAKPNPVLLLTTVKYLLLDTVHYKPSQFIPLDMPETTDSLNIICKRG